MLASLKASHEKTWNSDPHNLAISPGTDPAQAYDYCLKGNLIYYAPLIPLHVKNQKPNLFNLILHLQQLILPLQDKSIHMSKNRYISIP